MKKIGMLSLAIAAGGAIVGAAVGSVIKSFSRSDSLNKAERRRAEVNAHEKKSLDR